MLGVNYLLPGIVDWIKNMTNGYMGLWVVAILVVTIAYFIRTVFGLFISLCGELYLFWKYGKIRGGNVCPSLFRD